MMFLTGLYILHFKKQNLELSLFLINLNITSRFFKNIFDKNLNIYKNQNISKHTV